MVGGERVRGGGWAPNIVLITVDTTRADRMGSGFRAWTDAEPHALARQSWFSQGISQGPADRALARTILTGTYPQFHQVNNFGVPLATTVARMHRNPARRTDAHTELFSVALVLDPVGAERPGFDRGLNT